MDIFLVGYVTDPDIPLAKDALSGLTSNIASSAASNAINKFERRIIEQLEQEMDSLYISQMNI